MASETTGARFVPTGREFIGIGLQSWTISERNYTCIYKDVGKLIERCIVGKRSMTIHLPMFTETRVEKAKLGVHRERVIHTYEYITNAKSIVHFVVATRLVFVSSPARGVN